MTEQKRSPKTIDIVSYALEVSVNGVTCVLVFHFKSSDTFESLQTGLTVHIHVSTKTCVTGNNLVLHKALCVVCGMAWCDVTCRLSSPAHSSCRSVVCLWRWRPHLDSAHYMFLPWSQD